MSPATVRRIADRCRLGGLDLTHALSLRWLDEALVRALPDGAIDRLAILIGNTRAIWPFIRQARRGPDPVERHCELVVAEAVDGLGARLFHAHRRYDGAYLPLQRIAHQAGMLHLSPSHLSLHGQHGPWVALRALIVVDQPGPTGPAPRAPDPCTPCDKPCLPALAAAVAGPDDAASWRRWLAVRDACPVGRVSRYRPPQVAYHYTKDPTWLDVEPEEGSR